MARKDTLTIFFVMVFIVTPTILALVAYVITHNPSLRPLGMTIERMVQAGQIEGKGLIVVVVDIGEEAEGALSPDAYKSAFETTFDRLRSEALIHFRSVPRSKEVNVTYLVGDSQIGPYPAHRAAEGVKAALQAEKMLLSQKDKAR